MMIKQCEHCEEQCWTGSSHNSVTERYESRITYVGAYNFFEWLHEKPTMSI